MKTSLKKSKILEAKGYYQNAKNELKKAKLKEQDYQDNKYVRSARDFAWKGVLFATEYLFEKLNIEYKPPKKGSRITDYNNAFNTLLSENYRKYSKIEKLFSNLYEVLYKSMGYDGVTDSEIIDIYLTKTEEYINLVEDTKIK